ncbi:arm repeat-containing protein [Malassezia pachydermatis]|uniref:Arm repeat-containing protein n=1 Tax=Malassezia pachydermatis TaxID=77020 RepID=A0A0M8MY96_9BASI|nr:arm repeat-containing protein [Malassezia pachydermatis]KOS15971.1 arm repeat-containing protein [Malassezia pachydermatis]
MSQGSVPIPLRRKSSQGTSMHIQLPLNSPPAGGWHHSGLWPDGQFSASSTARITSPLSELHEYPLEHNGPAAVPPLTGPDVIDSVWLNPKDASPDVSQDAEHQPPTLPEGLSPPTFTVEGTSPGDKFNLTIPRLSTLFLGGDESRTLDEQAKSDSSGSPQMTPDSPPKTRSHIALPPRSGYAMSDDSDSLRSDGESSVDSGRSSTDSGSDNETEDVDENEEEDVDESEDRIRKWQMARTMQRGELEGALSSPSSHSFGGVEDTLNDSDSEDDHEEQKKTDLSLRPSFTGDDDGQENSGSDDGSADGDDGDELEDGLSSLERIFLFAKSDLAYHRVLVSRCLAEWIKDVDLTDAVEYVIPLLNGLATDELEVSAVFAPELGRLMWFFFRNCPLAELSEEGTTKACENEENDNEEEERMPRPKLPVQTFTSLLCTLLLNPNSAVSGATQASIVEYFLRSKQYDEILKGEDAALSEEMRTADLVVTGMARERQVPLVPYEFGEKARHAVLDELFEHVAIAISRVETSEEADNKSDLGENDRDSFDEESAVGRMMSVNLLAAITVEGGFSQEQLVQRVVPEITSWPSDPAFFVRKEVAAAIGIIGKALVNEHTSLKDLHLGDAPQRLFEAINRVLLDHVWQVRQAACYSLPGVFGTQAHNQARRENLVLIMKALKQDISPNVQLAAFEMIGEIIYLFHEDNHGTPAELVHLFLGQPMDGADADASSTNELLNNPDLSLIVAFNFPAVLLTLGAKEWPKLREMYMELSQHVYENVRNTLAASIHEVAKILGPDVTSEDLLPVAERFLHDSCTDVTATLLEHIDEFWLILPPALTKEQLRQIPALWLAPYVQDWRLRRSIASHIPALVPALLLTDEDGCLVTLLLLALNDSVSAMRELGIQATPIIYTTFAKHDQTIADGFLSMLCDLAKASSYRQRVTFLHIVSALLQEDVENDRFEQILLPYMVILATDDVLDVAIALAQTCEKAWQCCKSVEDTVPQPPFALVQITATLLASTSPSVRAPLLPFAPQVRDTEVLPVPPREARQLRLGPAPSVLDSASIPTTDMKSGNGPAMDDTYA